MNDALETSEKRLCATNATEFIIDLEIHRSFACSVCILGRIPQEGIFYSLNAQHQRRAKPFGCLLLFGGLPLVAIGLISSRCT